MHLTEQLVRAQSRARGRGLGRIPGLRQLGNRVVRRARDLDSIAIHTPAGLLHIDPRDEGLAPALLKTGTYELATTMAIGSMLRPGMIFADIGANVGYFTLVAARAVGAAGRVFAFEPEPRNLTFLNRNVRENRLDTVIVREVALSDREGTVSLFVDERNIGNPSFAQENVSIAQHRVEVPTAPLDGFFPDEAGHWPDVVKIDVQGAEALVLAGAVQTLDHAQAVFIEIWPWGIRNVGGDPSDIMQTLLAGNVDLYRLDEEGDVIASSPAAILNDLATDDNPMSHRNLLFRRH